MAVGGKLGTWDVLIAIFKSSAFSDVVRTCGCQRIIKRLHLCFRLRAGVA